MLGSKKSSRPPRASCMRRLELFGIISLRVLFHHASRADRRILMPRVSRERSGRLLHSERGSALPRFLADQTREHAFALATSPHALSWRKGRLKRKSRLLKQCSNDRASPRLSWSERKGGSGNYSRGVVKHIVPSGWGS